MSAIDFRKLSYPETHLAVLSGIIIFDFIIIFVTVAEAAIVKLVYHFGCGKD
jgi:hypothetical protein